MTIDHAGRSVAVSVTLDPETLAIADDMAAGMGIPRSALFRIALRDFHGRTVIYPAHLEAATPAAGHPTPGSRS